MFRLLLLFAILAVAFGNGRRFLGNLGDTDTAPTKASSPFWPQPQEYTIGSGKLSLSNNFRFVQSQTAQSALLERGIDRYVSLIGASTPSSSGDSINSCSINVSTILSDPAQEKASLDMGVDESYTIDISGTGACQMTSATVWGALHAMETFTQLLNREASGAANGEISMNYAPVSVQNFARFSHRGLLIDSARHFLPVATIKGMIDTLPMAHFNVLHWHLVDAQSFPFNSPSSPEIIKGAFNSLEVYSVQDLTEVDAYATDHGVRIMFEVDGPGHTASWGEGYPEILATCLSKYSYNVNNLAVNPVIDKTYEVLAGILKDIVAATGTKYMHLGGDEVVYGCWAMDASITAYMSENGITNYADLLSLYGDRAEEITRALGATPIQWEDTFMAGCRPPKSTIFDVWTNSTNIGLVTDAGYRVIAAPQNYWYLDHAANTWQVMYQFDPTAGQSAQQAALIVGGEASMWGEMVDQYNIFPKVWPTAAAVGERLWSSMNNTAVADIADAQLRLNSLICRMNARGVPVGPINPGYCAVKLV